MYTLTIDDHNVYINHRRSLRNVFISSLLSGIEDFVMCPGAKQNMESSRLHSIPIETDENSVCQSISKEIYRAEGCHLLSLSLSSTCEKCVKIENEHSGHVKRTEKNINVAAKPRAPLSCTHPNKVALALKEKRIECTNQKATIERMQREIEEKGVEVESDLRRSVCDTMTENADKMAPFVKLFLTEQQKHNLQGSFRFHPMIIRFALSLAMKPSTADDELRRSGTLILPSSRTLRDYKNAITPSAGFNPEVIAELRKTCEGLTNIDRFVVLSFDEVKIQSDLVFDKHSGKVIGFVDVRDYDINFATFSNLEVVATHVLCFFL